MTDSIKSFFDLRGWQECHKLVLWIYKLTNTFPKEERYSLVDQIRRACISITSNIAEGFSRSSRAEKVQFYSIALGSLTEVQNQLTIAKDVGYVTNQDWDIGMRMSIDGHKLIQGLMKGAISRYS